MAKAASEEQADRFAGWRLQAGFVRDAVRVGLFPALMVLGVGGAMLCFEREALGAVGLAVFFGTIPLFFVLERLLPWQEGWLGNRGDVATDIGLFVSAAFVSPIQEWGTRVAALGVVALASDQFGGSLWPSSWPILAQGILALVVGDFFRYWVHRAFHEVPILWRVHATHHSSTRLYFWNGARLHPIEVLLSGFVENTPLVILGVTPEALALRFLIGRIIGRFQHANLDVELGPLDYVFSSPKNHRWHHARRLDVAAHNYGGDLVLFDHLFGTFYLPKNREPDGAVGIEGLSNFPQDFWGVLLSPFRGAGASPDRPTA